MGTRHTTGATCSGRVQRDLMRQEIPPLTEVRHVQIDVNGGPPGFFSQQRVETVWVSRITGILGAAFLIIALTFWTFRPGHLRLVLAFLVLAMFAAVLHSYTFDSDNDPA
jgi:hypothetical protein